MTLPIQKIFLGLFTLSGFLANCQSKEIPKGEITIYQDTSVASLIKRNTTWTDSKVSMSGYRLQIHLGADRIKANEIRVQFLKDHPATEAYLLYQQPNFKVRVGDYKTRLEAVKALQILGISYPGAFIVKDEVKFPKSE